MASIWLAKLLFFELLLALATNSNARGDGKLNLRCHPDQAATLIKLKKSFFFDEATTNLSSWQEGTDCCRWEGVGCGGSSGQVTALSLRRLGLRSNGLNPVICNLTSLKFLDLSMTDFSEYNMSAVGLERLIFLTHLNLSNSNLEGEIPVGIGKLTNLVYLDLSSEYPSDDESDIPVVSLSNSLWISDFQALVGNLSNLRELRLDGVDMSTSGENWCNTLAKSVPRLQVLSLEQCSLSGSIHQSLSNLTSLTVINLQEGSNIFPGPFPEFFMDFVNLSVLRLANINLEGWLPPRIFQSKKLSVLDLSGNMYLSGSSPKFPIASSLRTLRLDDTNLSFSKTSSSGGFLSLQELALDVRFISMEFLSSFNMLVSLNKLRLGRGLFRRQQESIFSWIGDMKKLSVLELYECDFSGTKPSSISNFNSLRSLRIYGCNLSRPILSAVGNLVDLQSLYMSSCVLNAPITSSIGNLTNLNRLDVSDCGFLGRMPSSIGNLVNLRSLSLDSSYFSGKIPSTIGNLTNLRRLDISDCGFIGPLPTAIGNLADLRSLTICSSGFSGAIPYSIGNLTSLLSLDLSTNYLTGEIPTSLFNVPLQYLDLSGNQLFGPIKELNVVSSDLEYLSLERNELNGKFPRSFFELTNLVSLFVGWNNLVGTVELTSFQRLTKLCHLRLSHNKLSIVAGEGNNNSSSSYLSGLSLLGLASCKITEFPSILTRLGDVGDLDLSCNKLNGDIPNWIWSKSFYNLNLSHNMFTGMKLNSTVLPLSIPMHVLDLSSNGLQGQIPMPYSSVVFLDYSDNNFSSVLPNFTLYLGTTTYLKMSNNSIKGHIPQSVCNLKLDFLDLSYNNFSGVLPSCLIEDASLTVLNLRENHFEGTLPSDITSECTFRTVDLHGNKIEGQLPRTLSNCKELEVFDIGNNLIVDTFPSWLGELPNLYVLIMRFNHFYGYIDYSAGNHHSKDYFSSLQIIDLASNNFSGTLNTEWFGQLKSMMAKLNSAGPTVIAQNISTGPGGLYQDSTKITYKGSSVTFEKILTTLTAIDFSNNKLEGTIPESVGWLVSLHVLNMSHNAFTGKIPSQLGGMTYLESMDLSCNQLSGNIPQELANLTFLGTLNLSDNQLVGKIPQSRQFSTFDNSSFKGNLRLYGPPLSNTCVVSPAPPSLMQVEDSSHVDVILFLFVGLGYGIGFAAAILMRWGRISEWFIKSARALKT
ncbi:receptor like protein 22-like [Triticum dicoccoides]|uniref:receptor like protein 22-like n=1 Tax=Triticum dicoccoides TaxID=85692 RepID=UPI00188F7C7C|nr:receptor like protein 22-like [Triticum dicoccoides]